MWALTELMLAPKVRRRAFAVSRSSRDREGTEHWERRQGEGQAVKLPRECRPLCQPVSCASSYRITARAQSCTFSQPMFA